MVKLKLFAIPDDRPVKLPVELPAAVHRDLVACAEVFAQEHGLANRARQARAVHAGTVHVDRFRCRSLTPRRCARSFDLQASQFGHIVRDRARAAYKSSDEGRPPAFHSGQKGIVELRGWLLSRLSNPGSEFANLGLELFRLVENASHGLGKMNSSLALPTHAAFSQAARSAMRLKRVRAEDQRSQSPRDDMQTLPIRN
jgi:hypothetical protein